MAKTARVAITGLGVVCPIGDEPSTIVSALREGRSGIEAATLYPTQHLRSQVAAEVKDRLMKVDLQKTGTELHDRTAWLAVAAALRAWESAAVSAGRYSPQRTALCVGASGAGLSHGEGGNVFRLCFQPQEQATAVVSALGIEGPVVMFSSASAGSGLALVHAMNLLRGGYCDVAVAGGAECLSQVNHESMDSMGLCSVGPCSPFSGDPGLTVGEGSAFFVLERMEDAIAREARIQAELFGFGATQDAYDVVGGDPSGEGLARAFAGALQSANKTADAIDWIKANGTSNREQDLAETLAVKQVFEPTPPVVSLESFVGHANGAAPAIGLALAVMAFQNGFVPPTLNYVKPRSGCELDYVPNEARVANAACVLASSVGFGGSNVALLFGRPQRASLAERAEDGLCITGIGVISPFGQGFANFIDGLRGGGSAIRAASRWKGTEGEGLFAGMAEEPQKRKYSSRFTLLQRFALAAAEEALESSRIMVDGFDPCRIGLFVGLCRGSAAARSRYAAALTDVQARKSIGKLVLGMGRFTVASAVSQLFKLKGYGATISEGFGAGLHALAHACVHLENSAAEEALLVIAADESGGGPASSLGEMNWLAKGHDGCYLRPYDPQSSGTMPGEGAVALVVERAGPAEIRGARILARVRGVGLTASQQRCRLVDAIEQALAKADSAPRDISAAYGNGSGIWAQDEAEMRALRKVLPEETPLGCVNAGLGFAESASGLFQVAAAIHGLSEGEFFPVRESVESRWLMRGSFRKQLLTAKTEGRRNAAVVLGL